MCFDELSEEKDEQIVERGVIFSGNEWETRFTLADTCPNRTCLNYPDNEAQG